jgi:hypothetical protein
VINDSFFGNECVGVRLCLYDRRAVSMNPLHLEAQGLLAEVLGMAGDFSEMRAAIENAVEGFWMPQAREGVLLETQAAVFHKLGTVFLTVRISAF